MGAWWYDSFVNLLAGIGGPKDKLGAQAYSFTPMMQASIEAAYRSDWIARKVIDIPAFDSTRAWRAWQADEGDIEEIEKVEKELCIQQKVQKAMKLARLYGGAALIMGVDVGLPEEELDPELVTADTLKFVHVVSMFDITAGEVERDLMSLYFGEPKYYERNMGTLQAPYLKLHPSRVIRFIGAETPDPMRTGEVWGDSVLQVVDDAVRAAGLVQGSIATLIAEAKIDIINVPGLSNALQTKEGTDRLIRRFSHANSYKSIINSLLLDKDEEYHRIAQTFTGMPDILQMYLLIASGAADIPATRLLGQSPAGMNATGESDIRNYYDRLHSDQASRLQPALARLDEVLIRSALGTRDESIFYIWNSLWQLDDVQKAALAKSKADTYKIDVDSAMIPEDILREARENQLVEDGVYPGLEQIMEDFEAANGDQGEAMSAEALANMPPALVDPNAPPVDPNAPPPKQLKGPVAQKQLPPPKQPGDSFVRNVRSRFASARKRKRAPATMSYDARPRTLYVSRPIVNTKDILDWAKAQGFTSTLPAAELHVTVVYSKKELDWSKINETYGQDEHGRVTIPPGGMRLIETFDGGAVVLQFTSSCLSWRHCDIVAAGGSSDYSDYQPHITITYRAPDNLDEVEPYRGPIVLGPEVFKEIVPSGFDPKGIDEVYT